jgi:hypothetical protein
LAPFPGIGAQLAAYDRVLILSVPYDIPYGLLLASHRPFY